MGLFSSRSSSKNETNNFDNRVVNDYQGAAFDYGIDGNLNNNTGSVTMVDAGSLDAMRAALNASENIAQSAIVSSGSNAAMAVDAVRAGASDALEITGNIFNTGVNAVQSIGADALTLADGSNQRTLSAALNITDASLESQSMGNELAFALADNARGQTADTLGALGDGFAQMMQFTETFSRSDGASLAKTNLYTVGVIAVAGVAAVFFLRGK